MSWTSKWTISQRIGWSLTDNGGAAEPAGGVFDHGVGFREDFLEVFGAGSGEFEFRLVEGGLGGLDRFRSGFNGRGHVRKFVAERGEAELQGPRR